MAQRIFQSFRRLPGQINAMRKKQDSIEVVGNHYKINVCSNIGFPAKPASIAYDQILDIFALATRDGCIFIYGKPGVAFTGTQQTSSEIIKIVFITGTGKLVTLTDTDDVYVWQLASPDGLPPCLQLTCQLENVTSCLQRKRVNLQGKQEADDADVNIPNHITALMVAASGTSIFFGSDQGCVASIRHYVHATQRKNLPHDSDVWLLPTYEESIHPQRVLQSVPSDRRSRLRLDAVVVLSERPGAVSQLLIGYNSGVSIIYDLQSDCTLALLPWQYGLESAAWCGGGGLPLRSSVTGGQLPAQLGTRLLTSHTDGSLGVWRVPVFTKTTTSPISRVEPSAQIISMEEAPSMPYGPFPCKTIGKVFWLPSHRGGITVFSGGMPRATYGSRHTVSLLRGSNLDQAAAANLAAAAAAAVAEDDDFNEEGTHEDEEEYEDDVGAQQLLASGLVPGAPVHVFDADAPEHVCLDLPSPLVDLCSLGSIGGPAKGLLILCEEELVAVDLLTPNWPLLNLPYLPCLHSSSISTYRIFTRVSPKFLAYLDQVSECGKGDANGLGQKDSGYSRRRWPIQGGECILPAASTSTTANWNSGLLTTSDDLLVIGHENGTVGFWRLGPGGVARKVFTLFTGSLFEGEFGPEALGDPSRDAEEEADAWPPFRKAGLFDPFMDDVRAAVKSVCLIESTLVVGGSAGQITAWQFADERPLMDKVDVPIAPEIPRFRWKGHMPLKLRPISLCRLSGLSLYPIGIALAQPPAQVTSLAVCEIPSSSTTTSTNASGVLLGFGTAHGFGVVHFAPSRADDHAARSGAYSGNVYSKLLLAHSTIPANTEALEEAAVGEGWTRRRTREIKNSLRDSFRRLKRMRSVTSIRQHPSDTTVTLSGSSPVKQPAISTSVSVTTNRFSSRVGLRRSVTQGNSGPTYRGDPLSEALQRSTLQGAHSRLVDQSAPVLGGEREVCDRPTETANTAVVRCVAFGPPIHRLRSPQPNVTPFLVGSFFAGTSGGSTNVYAIFSDRQMVTSSNSAAPTLPPSHFTIRHTSEMQLHHRAPIVSMRLIDTKTHTPLSPNSSHVTTAFGATPAGSSSGNAPPPHLVVVSEEQVRLFSLPGLHLRQKIRITAKDGFRIKSANIMSFQPTPQVDTGFDIKSGDTGVYGSGQLGLLRGNLANEFGLIFTNNNGEAVVVSIPFLRRRDTMAFIGSLDYLAVNSVTFAENSSYSSAVPAPSLGLYQIAPGQLILFDVLLAGQKASLLGSAYRSVFHVKPVLGTDRAVDFEASPQKRSTVKQPTATATMVTPPSARFQGSTSTSSPSLANFVNMDSSLSGSLSPPSHDGLHNQTTSYSSSGVHSSSPLQGRFLNHHS